MKNLKTVILCGGKGTRFKEETEKKPKPLILLGEMPILWHIMKTYSHYNYKNFILCLGYKGEMIRDYFLNFEEWTNDFTLNLRSKKERILHHNVKKLENWNITFVNTGQNSQTGTRVMKTKKYIGNDKEFLMTYGDGVADVDITSLLAYHRKHNKILTMTGVHPTSFFGVIEAKNGLAMSFKEKANMEGLVSGGFFVCKREIFDYLSEDENCIFEEEPMRQLARDRQIAVYEHKGFWRCMDTYKQFEELNKIWDSGIPPWKVWK